MPRFFVGSLIGMVLLTCVLGCSGEQGASVAPPDPSAPKEAAGDSAKGKVKTAGEKPAVNVSPVQ